MSVSPPSIAAAVPASPQAELEALLASRAALIVIESRDEHRVLDVVRAASLRVHRPRGWGVFQWSVTEGLSRMDIDLGGSQKHLCDPLELLRHIKATPVAGIYVLLDFHPFLDNPVAVRLLKDIVLGYDQLARTLVLVSHAIALPQELQYLSAHLDMALPGAAERRRIVEGVIQEWSLAKPGKPALVEPGVLDALVENLRGVTALDCERLARQVIFDDGALTDADLPRVFAAKHQLLNRGGVLSYEPDTAKFAELGGMKRLRRWLLTRRAAFDGSASDLEPPKGVLLLGVQGCGKSLAAKAAAGVFGVPLLRLDFGALYSKWHGESERNLRESLAAAEALAPCVIWVDEIEKGLAAGDGDNGTSRRVLGGVLTWMSEQRARIFMVATANDISSLPAELIRKGRFDEIFFVDLPPQDARAEIIDIHARKRGIALSANEVAELARRSVDCTGAEIEQAIVAAQYSARARSTTVNAPRILAELTASRPLAVVMAERVAALRLWAHERTVPAD